jgi:hypothetical protein
MEVVLAVLGIIAVLVVVGLFIPGVGDVIGDIIDAAGAVIWIVLLVLCCGGCLAAGFFLADLSRGPG